MTINFGLSLWVLNHGMHGIRLPLNSLHNPIDAQGLHLDLGWYTHVSRGVNLLFSWGRALTLLNPISLGSKHDSWCGCLSVVPHDLPTCLSCLLWRSTQCCSKYDSTAIVTCVMVTMHADCCGWRLSERLYNHVTCNKRPSHGAHIHACHHGSTHGLPSHHPSWGHCSIPNYATNFFWTLVFTKDYTNALLEWISCDIVLHSMKTQQWNIGATCMWWW